MVGSTHSVQRGERRQEMTTSAPAKSAIKLTKSKFPRCLRCNKRVDALTVREDTHHAGKVIVEYQCHGETVSQEMPSSLLTGGQGLASYTAFNDYTSGLMLHEPPNKSRMKATRTKGGKK